MTGSEYGSPPRPRRARAVLGGLALALVAAASILAWLARTNRAAGDWALGAPAPVLDDRARAVLVDAIDTLEDRTRPGPERVRLYRERLVEAEELLVQSLRARPADARVLARLAAVRFELDPTSPDAARRTLETIELAASLAPRSGRIQKELGELLVRMGRADLGSRHYRRVVELTPDRTAESVEALLAAGLSPSEVLDALPPTSGVLAAVRAPFVSTFGAEAYLDRAESRFGSRGEGLEPELILAYVDTALAAGRADRLVERLEALGALEDATEEAWRRIGLGRGQLVLGRNAAALEQAEAALDLAPESIRLVSAVGHLALGAGRPERAVEVFREALRLSSRHEGSATVRARLYAQIGAAEEARGNALAAYDAYTMALRIDPDLADARRRLERMSRPR